LGHQLTGRDRERRRLDPGFTLIELVVVISLISVMLAFAMPRFSQSLMVDEGRKLSRWIMLKSQGIKESALKERRIYTLHIGLDTGRLWVTHDGMDEEALLEAEDKGYPLPDGYRVVDVEYPRRGRVSVGTAEIRYYPEGYSDKALIHVQDDDYETLSFLIEPFMSRVRRFEEHVGFDA
jgi:prepilin-type N-terminal cleavage/methylation domain-containing protein